MFVVFGVKLAKLVGCACLKHKFVTMDCFFTHFSWGQFSLTVTRNSFPSVSGTVKKTSLELNGSATVLRALVPGIAADLLFYISILIVVKILQN